MTDPETPVELPPATPPSIGIWATVLAGPVIWAAHFLAVYLAAEAVCAAEANHALVMGLMGRDLLVLFVVVATGLAGLGATVAAGVARRRLAADDSPIWRVSLLLSVGSIIAIVVVGLPTLVVGTC